MIPPGLSRGETANFFLDAVSMDVNDKILQELGREELVEVKDFAEFDKVTLKQVADSLWCPGD
eukprot:11998077-Ditylum_brightwellii.AAC.1